MFFYLSKFIWIVVKPGNLLLILFILGYIFLWLGRGKIAKYIFSSLAVLLVFIALFPVGDWLIHPLEQRFPIEPDLPEYVDGIIVLSGAVAGKATALTGQVQVNEQVDRELAFMRLARKYPDAKLLYTGGSSSLTHQQFKGADAGRQLLLEQGIDLELVALERDSRNTYESAVRSKQLVKPHAGEKWVLITTAWHMPRSVGVFCQVGWSVIPFPVDYRSIESSLFSVDFEFSTHLWELEVGIKEWIGLFAYWLSGRIPSLIPDRC